MRRKIAFALVLCMMVSLCTFNNLSAYADDWKLPEGTRVYKPGRTMALDFGTFTVLDAGFTKKAQSVIQVNIITSKNNGTSVTTENRHVGYYPAKDGRVLFALKGLLYNSSDSTVTLDNLSPTLHFGEEQSVVLHGYPAVPFGRTEYYTLEPDADVEIIYTSLIPNALYYGSGDIMVEFSGGVLGFLRDDLGNYFSMGFTSEDGETAGDITEIADAMMQPPAPKSTLAPLYDVGPSPVDTDFIKIEDVKLVRLNDGRLRPDIKVRCLYPEGALQVYPQEAWVYCYYLNDEDEVIQQFCGIFKHLGYNQAMWSKANNFSHMNGDDIFNPDEVSKIKFTWYHMITIAGGRTSWQQEWDLLEPVIYNVNDLEYE